MLPFKISFQCLDKKYFYSILMEFRLYIWNNSTILPQVIYGSFQSNIFVRKLTLLHFARFCVLIFIKYNKVIHKQAFGLGCKKTFTNKQF